MIQQFINDILYNYSYWSIYFIVLGYFLFLYFGLGPLFLWICRELEKKGFLQKITPTLKNKTLRKKEIKYSLSSIFIFGFSGIPIIYLIRSGNIDLQPNSWYQIMIGIIILTLWNELHFFIVHRIMHFPYFMKRFHYIHHQSKTPSVFSVYSFHPFEAFLLSTVPLSIAPWFSFAPLAIFLYPTASILLNYAGHCNYRFGNGIGPSWKLFGTHHHAHHHRGEKNYGFALNFLDKLNKTINPRQKS